ncbi:hypothetical protein HCN44_011349 [Aphidius gifuensis]|uniref:Ketosynthase family 3 (KS3) domain-containing protein n=2 Tax=Aphidius gifuensis TaxID=684658 RepID=A0A834XV97_APHGI|nr:hypothetical protein HCN44_011349 [Aphidius gifuensis]
MDSSVEVVISGFAGKFPESNNIEELWKNLMNKIDMITEDERRWKHEISNKLGISKRGGKLKYLDKFDAQFFRASSKLANSMDPSSRILLEQTYEAIVDAGINPIQLKGSKTGVYIASMFIDGEKALISSDNDDELGYAAIGCSRALQANRISYNFGFIGPSYAVDSACCSTLVALEQAMKAIKSGDCESAIVGGLNLCLNPRLTNKFNKLRVLSADGKCKTFDDRADGYVRSETVAVLFLQKSDVAKRKYATVVNCKSNSDGFKDCSITYPSYTMQHRLFHELYNECGVSPNSVDYVEAHGTGTKIGDMVETNSIESVFCVSRSKPLLIGSIKSNLGHSEAASGMCSIAKIIIASESGIIPPNLNFEAPAKDIKGIIEEKMKVVTDPEPWNGGYIGINSFGVGATNAHVLLKSNDKQKMNGGAPADDLPRIVVISGRTNEAVETFLTSIENNPVDVEYIRLLHDIHALDIPKHIYRGYSILSKNKNSNCFPRAIEQYVATKPPIYFIFSGIESQWPAMGIAFLRFPIFAKAIQICDRILRPKNIDIYNILTNPAADVCSDIINSSVAITALQIGLVDLLTSLNIVPDFIIGNSIGELACAYADGSLTICQTILASYFRAHALTQIKSIPASMATIELGHTDVKKMCPSDIQISCHNSSNSTTVLGPIDSVKAFVAKLTAKKIPVKEINYNNIAHHSRYVAQAYPLLLNYYKELIPEKKVHSSKWLSTSVPQSLWSSTNQFSSAEYHANNFVSPILFEQVFSLIEKNSIIIEIVPSEFVESILKNSPDSTMSNIVLAKKNHHDNVITFLEGIGKLFITGHQPNVAKLYPDIEFPVSRGTPMISPLVKWDHSDDWYVPTYTA